jgi:Cysteine-rich secretory protein family
MNKVVLAFKKYFIPHEGNNNKPHILRPRVIAFVCLVVMVAESAFLLGTSYVVPRSKLFGIILTNALVDETNQNRMANNLPALSESPLLDAAAQEKANDMVANNYFAHTSPSGVTPWYWFQNVGYSFTFAGENLAVNFSDSQDVTTAWMNSPEHRANILSDNFTQIGMATAQGMYEGEPATYVVELFGTPAEGPFSFVNTAAAASAPVAATIPAPAAAPAKPVPAPKPAPVTKPAPAALVKPTTTVSKLSFVTSSEAVSVAINGVEIPLTPTIAVTGTPISAPAVAAPENPVAQGNLIQQLFSEPRTVTDDFYILLMVIFAAALIMNIFIKIRVQYPRLIFGGLLVIVVAGLFIVLNQNVALLHAAIL